MVSRDTRSRARAPTSHRCKRGRNASGDHYVINGTKTWITLAQFANMIFVLARTDPAAQKQKGISFILVDMATPGVTVRPIETIDGGHEINEVHFENVRVTDRQSRR